MKPMSASLGWPPAATPAWDRLPAFWPSYYPNPMADSGSGQAQRSDISGESACPTWHSGRMNPAAPTTSAQRPRAEPAHDHSSGSFWWLAAVAAALSLSQLLFVSPPMGLGWDETVYVSQFSVHAPAAYFDAARARGVPLLVAPVTLLTSSVVALRVYLALASGLGLLVALWAWRRLRPTWVLALAGLAFGGLWVSQYYGPQAMPDEWVALSGLPAVGFFLQAATCRGAAGPLGSLSARLHEASAEQGGFGLHLAVWDELRAVNGPTLCRPCAIGWRYPELSLWWLALPVLVVVGIAAARRTGALGSSALAAVCGLSVAVQYLFLISYAAPRFLLPGYALTAIPVADGLAWLLGGVRRDLRTITVPAVAAALLAQLVVQHLVLDHEVSGTIAFHDDYLHVVTDLRHLGVRPPCVINGEQDIPIAFYAGCASAPGAASALAAGQHVAVLASAGQEPPGYARRWVPHPLAGSGVLRVIAYLPAGGSAG